MTPRLTRGLAFAAAAFAAAPLLAHPGHGRDGGSHELTHYFGEPDHLAPLALAAIAGVAAAVWFARSRRKV